MNTEMVYTLITGGNRGIGKALANEFANRGNNLLLVARNTDLLETVSEELRKQYSVQVHFLGLDLLETEAHQKIWDWSQREGYRINILVNNAGIGGRPEWLEKSSAEHADTRILLNIRSLVQLTRTMLPELKSHPEAYILNMGSISTYFPSAYKTVYSGTKAFVDQFSRGLREELRGTTVNVTVVNPNGVPTNSGLDKRIDVHPKLSARLVVLSAEKVARISVRSMFRGKAVVVPGLFNRILVMVSWILPSGFRESRTARIFHRELKVD